MKQLGQLMSYALLFVAVLCVVFATTLATAAEVPSLAGVGGVCAIFGLLILFINKE